MNFLIPFSRQIPEEDRRAYCIDAISSAYYGLFMGFLIPFIPVLLKRLNASPLELGLAIAAPFIALVVAFPFFRFFHGYKAMDLVTVPAFFSRLSVIFLGFTFDPEIILFIYLVAQFVEGFGLPAYTRVLKSMYSRKNRSTAMGYVRAIWGCCNVLAAGIGGLLLDGGNGPILFALAAISGAISAANFRRVFNGKESPEFATQNISLKDIVTTNLESRGFFWLNVTVTVFGLGNLFVYGILPTLLVEKFNISNTVLGYLNGLTSFTLVLSYASLGRFISSKGAHRSLHLGMAAGVLSPWLIFLAPSEVLLAVPFALNGIMYAGFELSWYNLVLSYAPEDQLPTYSSVYTFILGLRGLVGTMFANLALPYLGTSIFLYVGGLLTIAGMLLGISQREKWREE